MNAVTAPLPSTPSSEAPWGWSEHFRMPLYRPGTRVRHGDAWATVSHVTLRRHDLAVYLVGRPEPVDPQHIEVEPAVFTTQRVPAPR